MLGAKLIGQRSSPLARVMATLLWPVIAACSLLGSPVDGFSNGQGGSPDDCPIGSNGCDGVCLDISSNVRNCGGCGQECKAGETCNDGVCQVSCPGGQVPCGGLCYELSNDLQHCGRCDIACKAGEVCGNGQCTANCPTNQSNCTGSCADLQTDAKHCGKCGTSCSGNEECVAGKCVIACRTQLNGTAISDTWGWSWDGLERAATNWDEAKKTCEGFRGRLPTATELYRVSATQSANVGQTIHTNWLWSIVPYGPSAHVDVRLSDANTAQTSDSTSLNYRCVCPPSLLAVYAGHNCNGLSGSDCFAVDGEGKKHNVDSRDRAPLHKGGAIWECSFHQGRLAGARMLAEAIQQGLGSGSGEWLRTADDVHYANDALIGWSSAPSFTYEYKGATNGLTWGNFTNFYRFRCAGENYSAGPSPATVTDSWVSPLGRKSQAHDVAATTYVDANDKCNGMGGHLPTSTELSEFIAQGLPNGSGEWLWTSDQTGHEGTQFTVSNKRWTGTEPRQLYVNDADVTWSFKHTNTYPFRCIFYPVDTSYAGPAMTACAGGCTLVTFPGTSGMKMWFDSFDRAPPATATEAIDTCRKLGGHLPSERDLLEAIRHGSLPNGTGTELWSSDLELGTQDHLLLGVSKWQPADPQFDDLYPTFTTWAAPSATHPYRCTWTNELR